MGTSGKRQVSPRATVVRPSVPCRRTRQRAKARQPAAIIRDRRGAREAHPAKEDDLARSSDDTLHHLLRTMYHSANPWQNNNNFWAGPHWSAPFVMDASRGPECGRGPGGQRLQGARPQLVPTNNMMLQDSLSLVLSFPCWLVVGRLENFGPLSFLIQSHPPRAFDVCPRSRRGAGERRHWCLSLHSSKRYSPPPSFTLPTYVNHLVSTASQSLFLKPRAMC